MELQLLTDKCEGHGMCELTAPLVYELDEEGYVRLVVDPVPDSLAAQVEAGARVCPVAAIRLGP